MAIKFNQAKGEAQKNKIDSYQYVEGDNKVRLVGDMLPRYVYWLKGENGKNLPFECLSFDRNTEAFNNLEKDWVRESIILSLNVVGLMLFNVFMTEKSKS